MVLLTAGASNIVEQALENTKVLGQIIYLAMIVKPLTACLHPIVSKELKITGTMNYTKADFQAAVDMLASAPETYAKLITHCFDFSDGQKAFEMMDKRTEGFVKVLLKL